MMRLALAGLLALSASAAAQPPAAETLPSGVVITHVQPGNGPFPAANDMVEVHYRGTLLNGTEFDSSYKRNRAASFPLDRVIPCWTEGMQKMQPGGKARQLAQSRMIG